MKVHMLNGAQTYQLETNGNPPKYPTPETLVNANGQPLGNGGGFPASNKANPYAHAQPGMYAGGSSLHGMPKNLMDTTIGDILDKVPELMQMIAQNPQAIAAIGSFAETQMINGRPGLTLPQTKGVHGFQGFTDIIDDNEAYTYSQETKMVTYQAEQEAVKFYAELIPETGFSTIYRTMQVASSVANRSSSYTHTMPDGTKKTFENPHVTVEKMKLGRHPAYHAILMTLESSNHPAVHRTFWTIDARKHSPDYALILVSAEDGTPSWQAAEQFTDDIYECYHDQQRTFLDRIYFDAKYGWEENTALSGTPGIRYFKQGAKR